MLKCPFCGEAVHFGTPALLYLGDIKKWSFHHSCSEDVSILLTGDTIQDVMDIWEGKYVKSCSNHGTAHP